MGTSLPRAWGAAAVLVTALALAASGVKADPATAGPPRLPTGALLGLRPADAAAMGLLRRPSPYPVIDTTGRLQRIRLDAGADLRAQRRDLARDAQAAALRQSGDAVAVEQARTAWRTQERLDALRSQGDRDRILTPGPWEVRGAVTRRILERSRIRLHEQQRERAVDTRADALRPPPPAPPKLGSLPPSRLEPPSR